MDYPEHRLTAMFQSDQCPEQRHSRRERNGTVHRIEHPDVLGIRTLRTEFLSDNTVLRKFPADHFPHQFLGTAIRRGDNSPVGLALDSKIWTREKRLDELSAGVRQFESEFTMCC